MDTLLPGTEVRARGLRWEVVISEPAGEQTRYRLRCRATGALQGHEVDILVPFEEVVPESSRLDPARAGSLDAWRVYHQAFLLDQALGPGALLAAQPGRLRIAPYQLVPVMRALRMTRPRLLLADGVGLGKTIEAGLVLAELIARRRAHRILVVSPPGPLLAQWREEMRERFGLRFTVYDRDAVQEIRRSMELGANPFDRESYVLVSIDTAKGERILEDLERTQWDVVVIDEAHHCASLGAAAGGDDSRRRKLAEVLARTSDALLLLTATPHDGFDEHFASIVELLDPSLVEGRALRGDAYKRHVVRRLKRHVKDPVTGASMFRERQVEPVAVPFGPDDRPRFAAFQRGLLELIAPQVRAAVRRKRYGDVLAFFSLLKRSVSSVRACRNTLGVIADRLDGVAAAGAEAQAERTQRLRTLREYRQRLERFGALSVEEERDQARLEAEDIAAELVREEEETARERRRQRERMSRVSETAERVRELAGLADAALAEDPKLDALVAQVLAIRAAEPRANVLVYTEYSDTQAVAVERLRREIAERSVTGEVLALSGDDDDETRTAYTRRFGEVDDLVLVSTDATAEGLNLHTRCHHLVHVELPYNPNRLEQRNGRIDRFGQTRDPVVRYLYLAGTFEERLLLRLVEKFERQRLRLGFVPNTLGSLDLARDSVAGGLLQGIGEEQQELFRRSPRPFALAAEQDDTGSAAYREMLAELEKAFGAFDRTAKSLEWLGATGVAADEDALRDADAARREGSRGTADVAAFVLDALRTDGIRVTPAMAPGDSRGVATTFEAKLTDDWVWRLDQLPGWDERGRVLRLTTDLERVRDAEGRPLGYLGRAHPIVRRALDRVRNARFGDGEVLDRRVSAARGGRGVPELLFTFLARVQSDAGPELERIIAVRVPRDGSPEALCDPGAWLGLAAAERFAPTRGVWERWFATWGEQRARDARRAALEAFLPAANSHVAAHTATVDAERRELDAWVRARADQLCGQAACVQLTLLGASAADAPPPWHGIAHPLERLAAFATSKGVPAARRREAEGVLHLHHGRTAALDRRGRLAAAEVAPLGLLLLVPAAEART